MTNINFLFTFLGQPGGIPIPEEAFLAIAEKEQDTDGTHFSLTTYDANKASRSIPTLLLKRGEMIKNIRRYRTFLKEQSVDLVFYHYHTFPLFLCGKPYLIKIHDTTPLNELSAKVATVLNALFARGIIVPSLATKGKVSAAFKAMGLGFLNKKIIFTPGLLSPSFSKLLLNPPMENLEKLSLRKDEYFFTTGADDLPFLCKCATEASQRKFVAGGSVNKDLRAMLTAEYGDRIQFTGFVDEQTLAALYAGAKALLYKNSNEGFGLIPLEAALAGTRVITNPDLSIGEMLGTAGEYYATAKECKTLIKKADATPERPPHPDFSHYEAGHVFKEHEKIFKTIIKQ